METLKLSTKKNININGLNIHYCEAGVPQKGKPALLLVHGFLVHHYEWNRFIPELSKEFHVIAPDLPGFGKSSLPNEEKPGLLVRVF